MHSIPFCGCTEIYIQPSVGHLGSLWLFSITSNGSINICVTNVLHLSLIFLLYELLRAELSNQSLSFHNPPSALQS